MDHPMHESVKLMRKELAQISASINMIHTMFPKGAMYGFVAAIMIVSDYHKQVTTLGDTWRFASPAQIPNYGPKIDWRHSEVANSSMEVAHKELQNKYKAYLGVENVVKAKILSSYDPTWLATLEDDILDFTHVTASEMLQHIEGGCLKTTNTEKK